MSHKAGAENWTHIASEHAAHSFMYHFDQLGGVYRDAKHDCLVVFNNCQFSDPQWKADEIAELRQKLAELELNVLGLAFYPPDADWERNTYAVLVDAPHSMLRILDLAYLQIIRSQSAIHLPQTPGIPVELTADIVESASFQHYKIDARPIRPDRDAASPGHKDGKAVP